MNKSTKENHQGKTGGRPELFEIYPEGTLDTIQYRIKEMLSKS